MISPLRLSVSTRLYTSFVIMALIPLAILTISYFQQVRSEASLSLLLEEEHRRTQDVNEWRKTSSVTAVRLLAMSRSEDKTIDALFGPEIEALIESIDKQYVAIKKWSTSAEELAALKTIDDIDPVIMAAHGKLMGSRKAGDRDAAFRVFEAELAPAIKRYDSAIDDFVALRRVKLEEALRESQASQRSHFWLSAAVMALLVAVTAAIVVALVRYIQTSLTVAVKVARTVASGDLTLKVQAHDRDEFGQLMVELNRMADDLCHVVTQVRGGTDHISNASQEIAHGNQDLSHRTEDQASRLQQTAATMEILAEKVRQSADNAGQANNLAHTASAVARRGGDAMGLVVNTMGQIEKSSRKIEEIIGVIDGISFQTNILALNAAVEAARAGEQGRGFAVVASEVRALAQRSATAAKEIKLLIADSAEKVRTGNHQVEEAGKTMLELVESVQHVSVLVGEISSSASDQRNSIDGVSSAVAKLDQTTQQNAALVEQAAAAAASMSEQARTLAQAVAVFKLV